jgi:hypothetical protein
MGDGFNAGWIAFERRHTEHIKGRVPPSDRILADLVRDRGGGFTRPSAPAYSLRPEFRRFNE